MSMPTCPRCGESTRPIVYGLPGPDLIDASRRGEVAIGGCIVHEDAPTWSCPTCGESGGRLGEAADWEDED